MLETTLDQLYCNPLSSVRRGSERYLQIASYGPVEALGQ